MKYTNKHGVKLVITFQECHVWHGKITGYHVEKYPEYKVFQDGFLLNDGFYTEKEAIEYAETIEF